MISLLKPSRLCTVPYRPDSQDRRIDWFHRTYAAAKIANVDEFAWLVNRSYYKHSAAFYDERYVGDIARQYAMVCQALRLSDQPDLVVVDIGGGTGFEYDQLVANKVSWARYFFIEPDEQMIAQFRGKHDLQGKNVTVLQGVLEDHIPQVKGHRNKLILLNSCLHHVIRVEQFLDQVKAMMAPGDYFLICHEPNNPYVWSPLMIASLLWRGVTSDLLLRKLRLWRTRTARHEQERWSRINQELLAESVIRAPMPPLAIRRVIDYWVGTKGDWRLLRIPDHCNEGYWGPADVARHMGTEFPVVHLRTYRHLSDPGKGSLTDLTNRVFEKLLPRHGSVFCIAFQKQG